jgi:hypothetical protein
MISGFEINKMDVFDHMPFLDLKGDQLLKGRRRERVA